MSFEVGDTIGDYQIVGLLGKGGMGHVYRVRNAISDHVDALKVISPGVAASSELADRFLREIKVHASLDHPNIAAFRTALRVDNLVMMVMELVEGVNLEERLRQGPVAVAEATGYIDQVLSALAFAHERGVIHRDIKPANLILTSTGQVKITDFGIAHLVGDPRLTATGMALGSLYYMCPEQVKSQPVDARSDLYSLGITFYEMTTGQRPIRGDGEYEILTAHLLRAPTPPAEVNPAIPGALSAMIMKALEKEPADRYQSAYEFRLALRSLGVAPGGSGTGSGVGTGSGTQRGSGAVPLPFDAEVLAGIEAKLAPTLGPVARQLVRRTARHSATLTELCRSLAEQIPSDADRAAFLKACEPRIGSGSGSTPAVVQTPTPGTVMRPLVLDTALIQSAKEKLAPLIGPIAGVLVDRTARKSRSKQEFFDKLAAEIASEPDRRAFLASWR